MAEALKDATGFLDKYIKNYDVRNNVYYFVESINFESRLFVRHVRAPSPMN